MENNTQKANKREYGELWEELRNPVLIPDAPEGYVPVASELDDVIEAAVLLGIPLLVTGNPGLGKTQLAYYIAFRYGIPLFRFNVQSTSTAADLLYRYDVLGRLYDAEINRAISGNLNTEKGEATADEATMPRNDLPDPQPAETNNQRNAAEPANYVNFEALGLAILAAACDEQKQRAKAEKYNISDDKKDDMRVENRRTLVRDFVLNGMTKQARSEPGKDEPNGTPPKTEQNRRSVVLIDEVDKAPRDFTNDLLNEFENMEFVVRETGDRFKAGRLHRPILILTSNRERDLPEPVLRRCAYFHIQLPGDGDAKGKDSSTDKERKEILRKILAMRLYPHTTGSSGQNRGDAATQFIESVIEQYEQIRQQPLERPPTVAELIQFALYLRTKQLDPAKKEQLKTAVTLLAKTQQDLKKLQAWLVT